MSMINTRIYSKLTTRVMIVFVGFVMHEIQYKTCTIWA